MSKKLANKIAVVTGASRGLGRATALRLAEEGATVIVHFGASQKAADEVVAEIVKKGGQAKAVGADLSTLAGAEKLADAVDSLDILINNAGVLEAGGLSNTTEEQFDKMFNVNVKSLFFVTQKLAPKIKDGGRVVNLSSVVSRTDFPGIAAYSATKGAVDVLTRAFANELGGRNITVNAIAPGATETEMAHGSLGNEEGRQFIQSIQALKRVGQPEEIADAIAAIVSSDGRWITGQVIEVSGGTKL
ncbi:MAG: SDR family oxidoreductase [Bryobacter sp.]|nr:SDR family oxidoreductase [Bryobacter sp.]